MRPLTSHLPDQALPTRDPLRTQTKDARGLRRAQAVREVVASQQIHTVSEACPGAQAARRPWGQRLAQEGSHGVRDRLRAGRPPHVSCARARPRHRRVAPAPLPHGAPSAPWRGQARAPVLARAPGGQRGRERGRGSCKNQRGAFPAPPAAGRPPPLRSADATRLWRCALPPSPVSRRQSRREEARTRQAWGRSRAWSRGGDAWRGAPWAWRRPLGPRTRLLDRRPAG
jgi:hypothetical protein